MVGMVRSVYHHRVAAAPNHWLIKSEPAAYSWSKLVDDGSTRWDGVRNFQARNNLRAMKVGDLAFFYHSGEGKEIVGVARVMREAYPDPTAPKGEDWSAVDFEPVFPLSEPVSLATIKGTPALAKMDVVRRGRLSVTPVTDEDFHTILKMAKTALPSASSASTAK
jgi:predicted RNA-binding protein with PUA-like domain